MAGAPIKEIRYYRFLDAKYIFENRQKISTCLFGLPANREEEYLLVNPRSGFIKYVNAKILGQATYDLPRYSLAAVHKVADKVLEGLNKKLSSLNYFSTLIPPANFLSFLEASAVAHPNQQIYDHWLIRYGVQLISYAGTIVPVTGSLIELRINSSLQVCSLAIKWKPVLTNETTAFVPGPPQSKKEAKSQLVYYLSGENEFQSHLLPYHRLITDDDSSFRPASDLSFTIDITTEDIDQGKIRATAIVEGGSPKKDFEFNWGYWKQDSVWDSGIKKLGAGKIEKADTNVRNTIVLNPGTYNLMVRVRDTKSGIIRQFQKHVFTLPILKRSSARPTSNLIS
jgi:hypothetical protein